MATRLPINDGGEFIAGLEAALAKGDVDYIERHLPRLERLIAQYQIRIYELAQLQYRAMQIRERHEPAAGRKPKKAR
jgi:predicted short-subunit dehydrogenase-like oxidoreductase (DUF2520 family)